MNKDELIAIGAIAGVHGIKGEVKAVFHGHGPFEWKSVYIGKNADSALHFTVSRARSHKGAYIIELEGVSTRDGAEQLRGRAIFIEKRDLPALQEGEYYYNDLIGIEVTTDEGKRLGKVTGVLPTGSNDVLEIKGPFGTVLIPAIEGVIIKLDIENKTLVVRPLEGLVPEGPHPSLPHKGGGIRGRG